MAAKRFAPPHGWPRWNKRCGAKRKKGRGTCTQWAIVGMPTCKYHGSGGQRNADIGRMRYLAWVITGGPQDVPVEDACAVALNAYLLAVFDHGRGSVDQQMKAALWLTQVIEQ